MTHTPGPWIMSPQKRRPFTWEIHTPTTGGPNTETVYRQEVARVIREGDANLVAAAPDLLEAITACLPDLKHYAGTHGPGPDQRFAALENVIARAKGEERAPRPDPYDM